MIQFNDVSYTYQKHTPYAYQALNLVTTTFEEGRYYAIIGKTGSGKSTLIQHLNGLLKPSRGTLQVFDMHVNRKTKDRELKAIRRCIGMVFQFPEAQLFEETVEKEILFGPKNFKMDTANALEKAKKYLEMMGIEPEKLLQKSPFLLSGGQMRKVAITSILACDPDVLILDEPTAGLDPISKQQVMTLIQHLNQQEGKTIILVSHEMNDVARYAEEVKVMKKGHIVGTYTPEVFFQQEELVKSLHLDLPDTLRLQRDLEQRSNMPFDGVALTEESFIELYEKWGGRRER
ncbi:energy-coupling factor transporter ATPase [Staphylococcus chromogenes]|uniref:energy-coupling factor transporter ATPase n=1 Tax=Staphylococcus chromogenes TaxID=46126 RepID=UPI000D1B1139|nr:energy-coupling factor transporter ATPase [Staphylococcus chromogenes]MDT0700507.1 energy-coupling factor transporter ATPase [Staphylococcus chromogenes]PTF83250.1 energy-coupling factor transporter ATPase [Staphylococcus chromogenes]PTG10208.1 energy-coupling factor transporter ATPase [Staphylococcus chromogenes]PTG17761.1 energy-coupling factor transporter ATPase [Staphylococcus chromogenes]PTG60160.1 energy-coupling factor transporter ATPase [Staphylococcus chromogenes]